MENEMFLKIRKQIDKELKITSDTVKDKTLKAPMLTSRYYNVLINEKRLLNELENKKSKIYGKLYKHYRYGGSDYAISTKLEAETFIYSDDKYLSIDAKCKEQKIIVDYFDEHVKIFSKIGFAYNTFLGFLKLEQGE